MTAQQLFGTAIRLFAIWLALTSVAYFSTIPSVIAASSGGTVAPVIGAYVVGALFIMVAALLWFFPMFVAHKLIPKTNHTNTLNLSGAELARTGAGILGLWLVVKAVPTFAWVLFRAFAFVGMGSAFSALTPELKIEFSVSLVELVMGVLFVVKADVLARIIRGATPAATGADQTP